MRRLSQHSYRRQATEELHARPFAPLSAPASVLHLAFAPETGSDRKSTSDLDHLNELLSFFGAPAVAPQDGRVPSLHMTEAAGLRIKWERHTEFISLMLMANGKVEKPFEPWLMEKLPQSWLDGAPGPVISSAVILIDWAANESEAKQAAARLSPMFDETSIASAFVTDREALVMSDFRMDANDFVRFAVIATPEIGPRRLGRITQRLLEIETYRTLAMLALPIARSVSPELGKVDRALSKVVQNISKPWEDDDAGAREREAAERETLDELTQIAARLEHMKAESSYRFDAAWAYDAIVWERLAALREQNINNRQTMTEFMVRRFKPSIRTCRAVADRLESLTDRVGSAANLLRTRVDVSLEAQNQKLLRSMNRRAQLQLRLQETVEGLSVIAISYYAVSLAGYALEPVGAAAGLSAKLVKALLVLPVVAIVWMFVRRLRKSVKH